MLANLTGPGEVRHIWATVSSTDRQYIMKLFMFGTIGGAFLVTMVRSTCNACAELMLGAVLVSAATMATSYLAL